MTNLPPGKYIGGQLYMAEVSSTDVRLLEIHQWPDEVGKPIDVTNSAPPHDLSAVARLAPRRERVGLACRPDASWRAGLKSTEVPLRVAHERISLLDAVRYGPHVGSRM